MEVTGIEWGWEIDTVMSPPRRGDTVVVMVVVVVADGMNQTRMTGEDGGRVGAGGVIARGSLVSCHRGIGGEGFETLSCRRRRSSHGNGLVEARIIMVHVGYQGCILFWWIYEITTKKEEEDTGII